MLTPRWQSPDRTIYDTSSGLEVVAEGDESRHQLAQRIVTELMSISEMATRLLTSFMRDSGEFNLESIEVFPTKIVDGGDFSLRYSFTAHTKPQEYNYTYFDVVFSCHEPPAPSFWPYKFTVGFH